MAKTYKVKNKLSVPLMLRNASGDEVQLPAASINVVDGSFIDFQLPPLSQAEVIGYDYGKLLAPAATPPTPVEDESFSA